jgi:hypothetical protein
VNKTSKLVALLTVFLGCVVAFNIHSITAFDPARFIPFIVTGSFVHEQDGMWRAHVNFTVTNDYEGNITIDWVQITATNITYVDDTFESMSIPRNTTIGQTYHYGENCTVGWIVSDYGFSKEPKILEVAVDFSVQGYDHQGTSYFGSQFDIVPEYQSFLVVLLIMFSTLIAVAFHRKKSSHSAMYIDGYI